LLVFLSVILFLQVIYRYVLEWPLPWVEEAARHGLVWFGMLASSAVARRGQHFVFRWATLKLPEKARFILRLITDVLGFVLLVLIFALSIKYLDIVSNQTTVATGLDMRVPYLGVSLGLGIFILFYVLDLVDTILSSFTRITLSERDKNERHIATMLLGHGKLGAQDEPS
jgi:C4-dicarboxylate transporter DctQ subunit